MIDGLAHLPEEEVNEEMAFLKNCPAELEDLIDYNDCNKTTVAVFIYCQVLSRHGGSLTTTKVSKPKEQL